MLRTKNAKDCLPSLYPIDLNWNGNLEMVVFTFPPACSTYPQDAHSTRKGFTFMVYSNNGSNLCSAYFGRRHLPANSTCCVSETRNVYHQSTFRLMCAPQSQSSMSCSFELLYLAPVCTLYIAQCALHKRAAMHLGLVWTQPSSSNAATWTHQLTLIVLKVCTLVWSWWGDWHAASPGSRQSLESNHHDNASSINKTSEELTYIVHCVNVCPLWKEKRHNVNIPTEGRNM